MKAGNRVRTPSLQKEKFWRLIKGDVDPDNAKEFVLFKALFPLGSVKSLENHHFSRVLKNVLETSAKCVPPPLLV